MTLKTSQVEELPGLNLTSMIDVVFLLLIFFMVATKFSETQQQIGIKLPGGAGLRRAGALDVASRRHPPP
jgi:biopolymer transport protein ExbD